jgi:chromate transport protein ChrA
MNTISNGFKHKKLLTILSVTSLLCILFADIIYYSTLLAGVRGNLLTYIALLLGYTPSVLLILYATKFHKHPKGDFFIPATYFAIAAPTVLSCITNARYYFSYINLSKLIGMITTVLFIVIGCLYLAKKATKALTIIALSLAIVNCLLNLLSYVSRMSILGSLKSPIFYYYLIVSAGVIARCVFLWICELSRSKKVPAGASSSAASPKEMLTALKRAFENGYITEEEYAAKRAEIISKL